MSIIQIIHQQSSPNITNQPTSNKFIKHLPASRTPIASNCIHVILVHSLLLSNQCQHHIVNISSSTSYCQLQHFIVCVWIVIDCNCDCCWNKSELFMHISSEFHQLYTPPGEDAEQFNAFIMSTEVAIFPSSWIMLSSSTL